MAQKLLFLDDKVTVNYSPTSDASTASPSNTSSQPPVLAVSNSPYSLRNRNQYFKITCNIKKQQKNHAIGGKFTYHYTSAPEFSPLFPQSLPHNTLSLQSLTTHNHQEIAIFMQPQPLPEKLENPKITIDDKVAFNYPPYPEASPVTKNKTSALFHVSTVSDSPYSLRNCNQYCKITSNTKI